MPNTPLYVVSKGRWEPRQTMRVLERLGLPYFVVAERQEVDSYRSGLDPTLATVLALDPAYQREYETCDDLDDAKSYGPGPARNFAWDHARAAGHVWHWVMDDNIRRLYRLTGNTKRQVWSSTFFRCLEDFADRYENVAMLGPNYHQFCPRREAHPPLRINTRIYSCNLIRNDVPFRWRGRYNEDTILSIDMLKGGWSTMLVNALLIDKQHTQTLRGGNTDEFYIREGTLPKSQMLVSEHPDICSLAWRFGRPHHHCIYSRCRGPVPRLRANVEIPHEPNEYGLRLVQAGA